MRTTMVGIWIRKCLPQVRSATIGWPSRRDVSIAQVLPSARTTSWPTKRAVCSFRMNSDGPSGTASSLKLQFDSLAEGLERPVRSLTFRYKTLYADFSQGGINGRILVFKMVRNDERK